LIATRVHSEGGGRKIQTGILCFDLGFSTPFFKPFMFSLPTNKTPQKYLAVSGLNFVCQERKEKR